MGKKYLLFGGVIVFAAAVTAASVFFSRDALARYAWEKYGNADVALALVRRDANLAMQLGNFYFNGTIGGGEYNAEKAKTAYEKAVAAQPGILWGHYQLARIYFVKGDFSRALEEINKELAANPENLRSLYVRGLIYGYSGNLEKAENDFVRFIQWAPAEWAGYNDLAWVLSEDGKYGEAKNVLLKAFQNVPGAKNNPWLWNGIGLAELNLKDYRNARAAFLKAKALVQPLTFDEWRRAYPGDDPRYASSGLENFRSAVEQNLEKLNSVDN